MQRDQEEFKLQAVNPVIEKQIPGSEMAVLLSVSVHSVYALIKCYTKSQDQRVQEDNQSAELKRLTEERDILKKTAAYFAQKCG